MVSMTSRFLDEFDVENPCPDQLALANEPMPTADSDSPSWTRSLTPSVIIRFDGVRNTRRGSQVQLILKGHKTPVFAYLSDLPDDIRTCLLSSFSLRQSGGGCEVYDRDSMMIL